MPFTPKTNEQLKNAVDKYMQNKEQSIEKYGVMNEWDVSNITDMSELFFFDDVLFDSVIEPINNWDVSNVKIMYDMFMCCYDFNQPLSENIIPNTVKVIIFSNQFNKILKN